MSLVAYAVRTCLWRALRGKTYAEDRVHDSSLSAIGTLVHSDPKPLLIVSTDDDSGAFEGARLSAAARKLDIVIEIVVGSAVEIGPGEVRMQVPATDEGFEQSLDFLTRQIFRVIQVDDSPFAEIFRGLACGDKRFTSIRGGDTTPRYAARQIIITCDTVNEPAFGEPPQGVWADLVAAMAADEMLEPFAAVLEAEIIGEAVPEWRRLQAAMGWTRGVQRAVGLGPEIPGEAPAPFTEATIEAGPGAITVAP